MKILIDTNVLYPTVMREVVLGVAKEGLFQPLWSDRILNEWALAAEKLGPEGAAQARSEIALLQVAWPDAIAPPASGIAARLWLPDTNDRHVLAAAIAGSADAIMTANAKDFPRNILAEEGLSRIDPDGYLFLCWQGHPETVGGVARNVLETARRLSGEDWQMRPLLKKAKLPRLGRALG